MYTDGKTPVTADLLKTISIDLIAGGLIFKDSRSQGGEGSSNSLLIANS